MGGLVVTALSLFIFTALFFGACEFTVILK